VAFRVGKYKEIILGNQPCQNTMDFQCFRNCHCPNCRRLMLNFTKHITIIAICSHSFTQRNPPPNLSWITARYFIIIHPLCLGFLTGLLNSEFLTITVYTLLHDCNTLHVSSFSFVIRQSS
jgi:hypothetical protein